MMRNKYLYKNKIIKTLTVIQPKVFILCWLLLLSCKENGSNNPPQVKNDRPEKNKVQNPENNSRPSEVNPSIPESQEDSLIREIEKLLSKIDTDQKGLEKNFQFYFLKNNNNELFFNFKDFTYHRAFSGYSFKKDQLIIDFKNFLNSLNLLSGKIKGLKNLENLKEIEKVKDQINLLSFITKENNFLEAVLRKTHTFYYYCMAYQVNINNFSPEIERTLDIILKLADTNNCTDSAFWLNQQISLKLIHDQPIDISPLRGLKNLQIIDLDGYGRWAKFSREYSTDLEPLIYSEKLQVLKAESIGVNNLNPISNFLELRELYVDNFQSEKNKIIDISPLAKLVNLQSIYLKDNLIKDLTPLIDLKNLKSLELSISDIQDIEPLKAMISINFLDLSNNSIKNISSLRELINLEGLILTNNKITDLSFLSEINKLTFLGTSFVFNPIIKDDSHCPINSNSNKLNDFCKEYLSQ